MKYRIVRDNWCGYEVQYLKGWWIFKYWTQSINGSISNTFTTVGKAREFALQEVVEEGDTELTEAASSQTKEIE